MAKHLSLQIQSFQCDQQFLHRFQGTSNAGDLGNCLPKRSQPDCLHASGWLPLSRKRTLGPRKRLRRQDRSMCVRITGLQVRALPGASCSMQMYYAINIAQSLAFDLGHAWTLLRHVCFSSSFTVFGGPRRTTMSTTSMP